MAGTDFVDVQLSDAGVAQVGQAGALRITVGPMSYLFTPGQRVRVLSSEWSKVLSREKRKGQTLFVLSPPIVQGTAPGTPAKAQLKALQAEETKLQTQIAEEGGK